MIKPKHFINKCLLLYTKRKAYVFFYNERVSHISPAWQHIFTRHQKKPVFPAAGIYYVFRQACYSQLQPLTNMTPPAYHCSLSYVYSSPQLDKQWYCQVSNYYGRFSELSVCLRRTHITLTLRKRSTCIAIYLFLTSHLYPLSSQPPQLLLTRSTAHKMHLANTYILYCCGRRFFSYELYLDFLCE